MTRALTLLVDAGAAGERLDKLLVARIPGLGRSGAAALFREGAVRVGRRRAAKGELAIAGTIIQVSLEDEGALEPEPDLPLRVVYEGARALIVEKPAGQPTAPLSAHERGTLAGALLGHYPELAGVGYRPREPGLVHRLDTETSGLVLVARDEAAFARLRAALTRGRLEKRYLAIVAGAPLPERGLIDAPIESDPRDPRRVRVGEGGERRQTRYAVIRRGGPFMLLELEVSRAYRHQIRAHLAHLGHPIAGDARYGGPPVSELGARHALHASYIAWSGDDVVAGFRAASALPAELARLLG